MLFPDGGLDCQKPKMIPDVTEALQRAGVPDDLLVRSDASLAVGFPFVQPDLPTVLLCTALATFLSICLLLPTVLVVESENPSGIQVKSKESMVNS